MIQKEDFQHFSDVERDTALQINPNMKTKVVNVGDGVSYFWGENVFKDIDKAVGYLQRFPALDTLVSTPGSRQHFSPINVMPLIMFYTEVCNELFPNRKFDPRRFLTSSIIADSRDMVQEYSWLPHTDSDITGQLYLNDYNGGTGLYKYRGYLTQQPLRIPTNEDVMTSRMMEWQKFEGDDDWELYHVIPSKENCIGILDGKYFHSTYTKLESHSRYVLSSFYHPNNKFL